MSIQEEQYLDQGKELVNKWDAMVQARPDRTGTGTVSVFGRQWRFDLAQGFPLLTTKFVPIKSIIAELLWFLEGSTDNNRLRELGSTIWDEWALEDGRLGPVYGQQWRSWPGQYEVSPNPEGVGEAVVTRPVIDQIQYVIDGLKNKPFSRRHIVSAWNVADLPDEGLSPKNNVYVGKMALAPCHCLFQFYVEEMTFLQRYQQYRISQGDYSKGSAIVGTDDRAELTELFDRVGIPKLRLNCQLYQRSADFCLGVPFNIASYALLTQMVAQVVGYAPGEFIHTFGDLHMYANHVETFRTQQMNKTPKELPHMVIHAEAKDIFNFKLQDFRLMNYEHGGKVSYPVAY